MQTFYIHVPLWNKGHPPFAPHTAKSTNNNNDKIIDFIKNNKSIDFIIEEINSRSIRLRFKVIYSQLIR